MVLNKYIRNIIAKLYKLLKWQKVMDTETYKKYSLYKYYAPTDYNFEALEKGYWFFSKFGHANDPFDCDINLLNLTKNKWGLNANDIKEGATNDFAICSFSDSPLNKRLWALYSRSYSGFVVEYEYGEEQYGCFASKGLQLPLFDVSYLDKEEIEAVQEAPHKKLIPTLSKDMSVARREDEKKEELFMFLYSIKEKSIWETEQEKRMLIGYHESTSLKEEFFVNCRCHNGYKVFFPIQSVKRIIAGMNISDYDLYRLKYIASKKYNISVEKVVKGEPFELKLINNLND